MAEPLENLVEDTSLNALISWILITALMFTGVENFLDGDFVFTIFASLAGFIALLPSLRYRSPLATPPWEILVLAVIPFVGVSLFPNLPLRYFSYVSTAGVAMMVVVELHFFTGLKMNDFFAVLMVAMTTIASVGVWALIRWFSDLYMGTSFLLSHDALMWEFVLASLSGIVAGIGFDIYFEHFVSSDIYDEVIE